MEIEITEDPVLCFRDDREYLVEFKLSAQIDGVTKSLIFQYNVITIQPGEQPEGRVGQGLFVAVTEKDVELFSGHIIEFYKLMNRRRPDKMQFLFEYCFNIPHGKYNRPTFWQGNCMYFGTAEELESLEVTESSTTIEVTTYFEDLEEEEWSFDSNSSSPLSDTSSLGLDDSGLNSISILSSSEMSHY